MKYPSMQSKKRKVRIAKAILIRETEKAYLVAVDRVQDWLPKSMISVEETGEDVYSYRKTIEIVLPEWLADQSGFEHEEII